MVNMSPSTPLTSIQVETAAFPPTVKPPASQKTHFLGGAGVRVGELEGIKFVKVTAIGVYLEDEAVASLSAKWKGKSADELNDSIEFFREIVTSDFEKFMRVTLIATLPGQEFARKVTENCVAIMKSLGIYTEAEEKAIDKFRQVFKNENFPPGSSILFTQFPNGTLAITFSKDESVPEVEKVKIENKPLSEAVLESMIGKHGVSPAARKSVATRLSELLKESCENGSKSVDPKTQDFTESKKDE